MRRAPSSGLVAAMVIGMAGMAFAGGSSTTSNTEAKNGIFDPGGWGVFDPGGWGLRTPWVRRRQVNQGRRIGQGIKSGQLTKKEVKKLAGGQKRVVVAKKTARSDGKVTLKERKRLHTIQNKQSKRIYRAKHNRRKRPRARKR